MAIPAGRNKAGQEVELEDKPEVEVIDNTTGRGDSPLRKSLPTMNKEKWLACVALCLSYTTAYQQNACTSAILKHIDEKLGI
jgi:hypothetical protein